MKTARLFNPLLLLSFVLIFNSCSDDDSSDSVDPRINTPTVNINENIVIETILVTDVISRSAKSGGILLDDGGSFITEKGVCWSIEPDPTIEDFKTNDGEGIEPFESTLNNLEPETKYFYRAYALNSGGVNYGNQSSFTTTDVRTPLISTIEPWGVRINTAFTGGENIIENGLGVYRKGICWSLEKNPDTEDNVIEGGQGADPFEVEMTDLSPETTYFVRSFAANADGIAYGEEYSFTTYPVIPLPEYHISYSGDASQTISKSSFSFGRDPWADSTYYFRVFQDGFPDVTFTLYLEDLSTGTYSVTGNGYPSGNLNRRWAWNDELNYRFDNGQVIIEEFDLYYKIEFSGRLFNAWQNLVIQLDEGRIIHWK
jgi:hypothetical protein